MPDLDPEQLTLFQTHIAYSLKLSAANQTQEWPLPHAATLDEAIDAVRGFGVFLIFAQGLLWGQEWEDDEAFKFTGFDLDGKPVLLEVVMQDSYTDREGNPL